MLSDLTTGGEGGVMREGVDLMEMCEQCDLDEFGRMTWKCVILPEVYGPRTVKRTL